MDLDQLRGRLGTIQNPQEAEGLKTFIKLAEKMAAHEVIMGKIMMSPLKLAQREKISMARDFNSIKEAFGPEFDVKVET